MKKIYWWLLIISAIILGIGIAFIMNEATYNNCKKMMGDQTRVIETQRSKFFVLPAQCSKFVDRLLYHANTGK